VHCWAAARACPRPPGRTAGCTARARARWPRVRRSGHYAGTPHRHLLENALHDRPDPLLRRRTAWRLAGGRGRRTDEAVQVVTLGLVQLQGVYQALEDAVRDTAEGAALQPRVVLDTDPREQRNLLTPQPRHPSIGPVNRQPGLLRSDLRPASAEELPKVGTARVLRAHTFTLRPHATATRPCEYPSHLSRAGSRSVALRAWVVAWSTSLWVMVRYATRTAKSSSPTKVTWPMPQPTPPL
jgi:hypothetical protein